jgi:prepilin-type N-terminal cleavage/methylation domain-containing protein
MPLLPGRRQLTMRQSRIQHGFTLIELLVVISIIALLISLLLPALGSARANGRRVTCLSQMRQIYVAEGLYAADNREWIVGHDAHDYYPHWHSGDTSWPWAGNGQWVRQYLGSQEVWFCPELPGNTKSVPMHSIMNPHLEQRAWVTYTIPHYSGINVFPNDPARQPFQRRGLDPQLETKIWTGSRFRSPLLTETIKFSGRASYDGRLFHDGGINIVRRGGDGRFFVSDQLPLPYNSAGQAAMETLFREMAQ